MKLWFSLEKLRLFRTFLKFLPICNLDTEYMQKKVKRGGIESEGEERRDRKWGRGKDSTGRWKVRFVTRERCGEGGNCHLGEFGRFCCPACCLLIIFYHFFWSQFFRRRRKSCCVRSQIFRWEIVRFPSPLASGRLPYWCQFGNLTSERTLGEVVG